MAPLVQVVHQRVAIIRLVPAAVIGIVMAVRQAVTHPLLEAEADQPLAIAETMSVIMVKLLPVVRRIVLEEQRPGF